MNLGIVGCRAGWPDDASASSGYLVRDQDTTILLDCGPGIARILSDDLDSLNLDAIVISHFHADHVFDLLILGYMLGWRRYDEGRAVPVPRLLLPAHGIRRLRDINDAFSVSVGGYRNDVFSTVMDPLEYTPGDVVRVGSTSVRLFPVRHDEPGVAVRVEGKDGASLAYSGDTGWCESLVDAARGADIFLCESTLDTRGAKSDRHLCAEEAGLVAAEAGVGQLVLTHYPKRSESALDVRLSDAAAVYEGKCNLARPGARYFVR